MRIRFTNQKSCNHEEFQERIAWCLNPNIQHRGIHTCITGKSTYEEKLHKLQMECEVEGQHPSMFSYDCVIIPTVYTQ